MSPAKLTLLKIKEVVDGAGYTALKVSPAETKLPTDLKYTTL